MSMICELFVISSGTAQQLSANPAEIHNLLESLDESENAVSLEKSWHALHFVLTGTANEGDEPLNFILLGGTPVGDEDVGYGPARLLSPQFVSQLNAVLTPITADVFDDRFDLAAIDAADIYPQIWDEPREELLDEFASYFSEMKEIVARAAQSNAAMLVTIR